MRQSPTAAQGGSPPRQLPLPGMAAISVWMLALSLIGVLGVLNNRFPPGGIRIVVLLLSSLFAVAGLGLMRLRRWGWALTLGAAFLSTGISLYGLFRLHQSHWLLTGIVNFIFFLYLIRPEVTERLR